MTVGQNLGDVISSKICFHLMTRKMKKRPGIGQAFELVCNDNNCLTD